MQSHSVPKCLLEQFAYEQTATKSLRLWRYAKGREPYPNASPKTATRIDGYFSDPDNAQLESEIEARLADEIEHPVHRFVRDISEPSFSMSETQRRLLTRYITLLFHRSQARRKASKPLNEMMVGAFRNFLQNESQVATVAAHWGMSAHFDGIRLNRLITSADIARAAEKYLKHFQTSDAERETFMDGILRARYSFDETIFNGEWRSVRTAQSSPFILSDSPVVTWERSGSRFSYGLGFHRENVEVLLPVSPTTCLHILPAVKRTRAIISPSSEQINAAQAAFAYRDCFANQLKAEIDSIVQTHISTIQIGRNAFISRNFDPSRIFYETLMSRQSNEP